MTVVIAVHRFPSWHTGGSELRADHIGVWLRRYGHDVHVVCVEVIDSGESGLTFEDGSHNGLPVGRLRCKGDAALDLFQRRYDPIP